MKKENFNITVEELCHSKAALRLNVDNTPNAIQSKKLKELIVNLLDPIISMVNVPIRIEKGFISSNLNKELGGDNSLYDSGMGVKISCPNNTMLFNTLKEFIFDEIVFDMTANAIYISYNKECNRKRVSKIKDGKIVSKNFN